MHHGPKSYLRHAEVIVFISILPFLFFFFYFPAVKPFLFLLQLRSVCTL